MTRNNLSGERLRENHRSFPEKARYLLVSLLALSGLSLTIHAQPQITIDHNTGKAANAEFKFKHLPSPSRDDAATKAKLTMVDAEADPNSADISALTDGILPTSDDQPRKNFFLRAGSGGGRVRMDLGSVIELAQINSYSWHSNARGPQVYRLWASDDADHKFNAAPSANINAAALGGNVNPTVHPRP